MPSDKPTRAIVTLEFPRPLPKEKRFSNEQNAEINRLTEASVLSLLPVIDAKLAEIGGRRLNNNIANIGAIVVEAPARSLLSLAEMEQVRSIIQDSEIHLVD